MTNNLATQEWVPTFRSHAKYRENNSLQGMLQFINIPLLVMLIQFKLSVVSKRSSIILLHCSHMVNFYSYNYSCFICNPSRAWLRQNNIAQQGCLISQNISLRVLSYLLLIRFHTKVPTHPNQVWSVDLAGYHVPSSLMNIHPFNFA